MNNAVVFYDQETLEAVFLISNDFLEGLTGYSNLFTVGDESLDDCWGYPHGDLIVEVDAEANSQMLSTILRNKSGMLKGHYRGRLIGLDYSSNLLIDLKRLVKMFNAIDINPQNGTILELR